VAQHKYKDWLLGVSVGLGVYHPGMTLESFIEQADRNLYRNKATKASAHIIREAEQVAGIPQPDLGEHLSTD
jgi:PleD family two-component response regulator